MDRVDKCMKIYKYCLKLTAELCIQLEYLESAIKNVKIDNCVTVQSESSELDTSDYENLE